MGSYDYGKTEIVEWVKESFPKGSTCLDVGACDGKWARLLGDYLTMDAVEIFPPNGARLNGYRRVFIQDIADYTYEHYDLIIFGDVIEHMTIEKAQRVLEYAYPRCVSVKGRMSKEKYKNNTTSAERCPLGQTKAHTGRWCSGNTAVSKTANEGSIPSLPAMLV